VKDKVQTIGNWNEGDFTQLELFRNEDLMNDTEENVSINPIFINASVSGRFGNK